MKQIFFSCILLASILTTKAQPFVEMSIGNTNEFFSHELQAGYRAGNTFISIGYISLLNSLQPTIFNVRGGAILNNRWLVYGGFVISVKSSDDKRLNSSSFQVGSQYHFCFYDRGTFYLTAVYTNTNTIRVTTGIGMSFNLFKD